MVAAFSKLAEFQFGHYNSNNIFSAHLGNKFITCFCVVVVVLAQFANENTLGLHLKISEVTVRAPHLSDFFCARKRNVLIKAFVSTYSEKGIWSQAVIQKHGAVNSC